jgi:hypothetical protein
MVSIASVAVSMIASATALAIVPFVTVSASTIPPDSEPDDLIELDSERQALVDDMLTISELQGAASDRTCVS